jgi:hypothetical protein
MEQTHLVAVEAAHRVVLGEVEFLAAPFAIPVLTGPDAAQYLDAAGGLLPDLAEMSRALHEDAELGSDTQAMYVFPHLVDAPTLALMLPEQAQGTVTAAMVSDAVGIAEGHASRLDTLVPRPDLKRSSLAFVVGVVFTSACDHTALHLNRPGWWQGSAVRAQCEGLLVGQLAAGGIAMLARPLPMPAVGLRAALLAGLLELLVQFKAGHVPDVSVELLGADAVELTMDEPAPGAVVSISRMLVGEGFVEELINGLSARLDLSAVQMRMP